MNSKGRGEGPPLEPPLACKPLGVCERGKPRLGMGGVPRSDILELGRRTLEATGMEEPIVRFPSMLARGARGIEVGMWIEFCAIPAAEEDAVGEPNTVPAIRELGRGIALSSFGPTTRDKSLAELMRVSSAFILEIISAIIRFEPAAFAPFEGITERGVEGTPIWPWMRAAARTDARSCARAEGEDVRPLVWDVLLWEGVPRARVDVREEVDGWVELSSCTAARWNPSAARTSLLNRLL